MFFPQQIVQVDPNAVSVHNAFEMLVGPNVSQEWHAWLLLPLPSWWLTTIYFLQFVDWRKNLSATEW